METKKTKQVCPQCKAAYLIKKNLPGGSIRQCPECNWTNER